MQLLLFSAIVLLGTASYIFGLAEILRGKYKPSVFSRVVWLLLAVNSFAGVLLGQGSTASILLAGILLGGNAAICLASIFYGTRTFGTLEYICVGLLVLSGLIWLIFDAPLLNLAISLFAHFIGALPTYKKVWLDPKSESTGFWFLFFAASILSIVASNGATVGAIVLPIYFVLFDGSMFALSLRKQNRFKE